MHLGHSLQGDKTSDGFVDSTGHSEQPVVAQQDRALVAQGFGDSATAVGVLDLHLLIVEEGVVLEKNAGLLGNRLDGPHFRRERRPPTGVHVGGAGGVGPGHQDRVVDEIRRAIDETLTLEEFPVGPDKD